MSRRLVAATRVLLGRYFAPSNGAKLFGLQEEGPVLARFVVGVLIMSAKDMRGQSADLHGVQGSPFARALRLVLEASGKTFGEWAIILDCSAPAISQWVNDKTVPAADKLRSIWDVSLRTSRGRAAKQALAEFVRIVDEPATQVSPHGKRMRPTIAFYMLSSEREGIEHALERLPFRAQIAFMASAKKELTQLQEKYLLANPSEDPVARKRRHAGVRSWSQDDRDDEEPSVTVSRLERN